MTHNALKTKNGIRTIRLFAPFMIPFADFIADGQMIRSLTGYFLASPWLNTYSLTGSPLFCMGNTMPQHQLKQITGGTY
jgi:hypothetical protein